MTALDFSRPDFRAAVIGAGAMGRGIAQVLVTAGVPVSLFDTRAGAADEGRDFIAAMLRRQVEKGRLESGVADGAIANITTVTRLDDLQSCPLVIEAVIEDLTVKRELFATLDRCCPAATVLATNTSSLSVTAIAAACNHPERVAGYHFFNPVPLMKVVEVVAAPRTDPAVVDGLVALARHFGHQPVRATDTPGFLINHAGRGLPTEGLAILAENVAPPADIDRVMREAAGFRMGPFELMDLTGLDVSQPVMESIHAQFFDEPRFRPSPLARARHDAGLLGRKSGAGWYAYAEGSAVYPPEPPTPPARPERVWLSRAEPEAHDTLRKFLHGLDVEIDDSPSPGANSLCLIAPLGLDATSACLREGLPPHRTVAVDTLFGLDGRRTLMTTPQTDTAQRDAAHGLFAADGRPVTVIADSPGFIAQRVVATIVNIACDIAQQGIATPEDIDVAVRLGLGYPRGPLELGDMLGPDRILRILRAMTELTGDPRYRPSPWLRRRADLAMSLRTL